MASTANLVKTVCCCSIGASTQSLRLGFVREAPATGAPSVSGHAWECSRAGIFPTETSARARQPWSEVKEVVFRPSTRHARCQGRALVPRRSAAICAGEAPICTSCIGGGGGRPRQVAAHDAAARHRSRRPAGRDGPARKCCPCPPGGSSPRHALEGSGRVSSGGRRLGGSRAALHGDEREEGQSPCQELPPGSHTGSRPAWRRPRAVGAAAAALALLPPATAAAAAAAVGGMHLEGPGSVLEAVAVLALIITVHECGHFFAARTLGIHVAKFAVGFGPALARYQGPSVEYTLRAIPLGGFVAFPDEDPESDIPDDDRDLLKNRPIIDRAIVVSAGVLANLLFAYTVLFAQVNSVGLLEQKYRPGVVVPDVVERSAAARGGLLAGDVMLAVNGADLPAGAPAVAGVVDVIRATPAGAAIDVTLRRGPELLSLTVTPDRTADGHGRIGVQLSPNAEVARTRAADLAEATELASREFSRLLATVAGGLQQIVLNFEQTAERVSGPVAIVAVGAEVARSDVAGLYQFAAILNLNLAVVNILPLPALDGGSLLLLVLEALRGRKLPSGLEQGIMSSGFLLMLTLGVVLLVRDTLNLGFFG